MSNRLTSPVGPEDHVRGAPRARVTLVEYGDYQCSYCGSAHAEVAKLLKVAGGRVRYVFRNFPLVRVHPDAKAAAEAAEAAATAGKFWEMHDWLFTHQDSLSSEAIVVGAEGFGLSLRILITDDVRSRVTSDMRSGERSGVTSTPSFFCNGSPLESGYSAEDLLAAVAQAEQKVAEGPRTPARPSMR